MTNLIQPPQSNAILRHMDNHVEVLRIGNIHRGGSVSEFGSIMRGPNIPEALEVGELGKALTDARGSRLVYTSRAGAIAELQDRHIAGFVRKVGLRDGQFPARYVPFTDGSLRTISFEGSLGANETAIITPGKPPVLEPVTSFKPYSHDIAAYVNKSGALATREQPFTASTGAKLGCALLIGAAIVGTIVGLHYLASGSNE